MAINVVFPLLIPLEEDMYNATRLLTGDAEGTPLAFTQTKYCVVVPEDAPLSASLATVRAVHGQGAPVRYALTGENTGLLFSIGQQSGIISLAAKLDYEARKEHEIVVVGEAGGFAAHALLRIVVTDVNDNPPVFLRPYPRVTVIEEDDRDLPLPLAKVEARDVDEVDGGGLEYSISGDGVDGIASVDAYFRVHPTTGEVTQLKMMTRSKVCLAGLLMHSVPGGVSEGGLRAALQCKREQEWKIPCHPNPYIPSPELLFRSLVLRL